jgi:two-component system NarL family sensor kinase
VLLLCSYPDIYAANNRNVPEIWITKADQFKKASEYDSARHYLQKAIAFCKLKKDVNHQIDYLLMFAETHYWQSNYSEALNYVLKAKSLVTESTPCKNKFNVELYVFRIQYALNEKDNALQGIKNNLPQIEKCGDSNLLYLNHYYHGVIYTETGLADSAIYHLNIANKIALKQQDFEGASKCHSVLADLYLSFRKNYPAAKKEINQALFLAKKSGEINTLAFAHIKMSMYYTDSPYKDYDKALLYLDTARMLFDSIESLRDLAYVEHQATQIYLKKNDAQKVYESLGRLYTGYDTIFQRDKMANIVKYQVMFDTKEKEKENLKLSLANAKEKQRNTNIIIGFLVALLSVLFAGTIWYAKHKAKLNEEKSLAQQKTFSSIIAAEEHERARIAKELHDGLGQILSTARLNVAALEESVPTEDEKILQNSLRLIDNAVSEVRVISHDLMPGILTQVGLFAAVRQLCNNINEARQIEVEYTFTESEKRLNAALEISVYRIIQEILNNMLRHAEATKIIVSLHCINNQIRLKLTDNGKGFDTSKIQESKGIGWKNVFSRVDFLKGHITIKSEIGSGTVIKIRVKLKNE